MDIFEKIDLYQEEINKIRPFENELLKQIKDYYRVGIVWSSNSLEGNTLTESETKVLLEDGLTVGGKSLREIFETVDHSKAYDYMFELLKNKDIKETDILKLHEIFYSNIEKEYAGKYRNINVIITGSHYEVTDFKNIEKEMKKLCIWIENEREKYHPVEFAALLHKKFVFIQPFKDGNGRVARLLMNTALIQKGYLPLIIPPILRVEYIGFLEKAHKDDKDFINFIAERQIESQKELMRLLHIELPKLTNDDFKMKM